MTKSEARYLQVGASFACPESEPPHRDTYERLSGGRYPELVAAPCVLLDQIGGHASLIILVTLDTELAAWLTVVIWTFY